MAKGIGWHFSRLLDKTVVNNQAKGIFVQQLRTLFVYTNRMEQLDIPVASSMFTGLTELWLVTHDYPHTISKQRNGVLISGIGFKNDKVRELVDTLNLGIESSAEAQKVAQNLYKEIFQKQEQVVDEEQGNDEE